MSPKKRRPHKKCRKAPLFAVPFFLVTFLFLLASHQAYGDWNGYWSGVRRQGGAFVGAVGSLLYEGIATPMDVIHGTGLILNTGIDAVLGTKYSLEDIDKPYNSALFLAFDRGVGPGNHSLSSQFGASIPIAGAFARDTATFGLYPVARGLVSDLYNGGDGTQAIEALPGAGLAFSGGIPNIIGFVPGSFALRVPFRTAISAADEAILATAQQRTPYSVHPFERDLNGGARLNPTSVDPALGLRMQDITPANGQAVLWTMSRDAQGNIYVRIAREITENGGKQGHPTVGRFAGESLERIGAGEIGKNGVLDGQSGRYTLIGQEPFTNSFLDAAAAKISELSGRNIAGPSGTRSYYKPVPARTIITNIVGVGPSSVRGRTYTMEGEKEDADPCSK